MKEFCEADNEVVRMLLRKRDSMLIQERDRFEDNPWGTRPFYVAGVRYLIGRRFTQYGVIYSLKSKSDHWDKEPLHFNPAPHLLETLYDVVEERYGAQYKAGQEARRNEILSSNALRAHGHRRGALSTSKSESGT